MAMLTELTVEWQERPLHRERRRLLRYRLLRLRRRHRRLEQS
jgi:hypothetical protein